MHDALARLRRHADGVEPMTPADDSASNRAILDDALDSARWQAIDAGASVENA
jgi:hypothetical protein